MAVRVRWWSRLRSSPYRSLLSLKPWFSIVSVKAGAPGGCSLASSGVAGLSQVREFVQRDEQFVAAISFISAC